MNRRNARIGIISGVYSLDFNANLNELASVLDDLKLNAKSIDYIDSSIKDVQEHMEDIDTLISTNLKKWTIERLPKVDLAILRVAVYEIKYCKDIPVGASINEAVEISKEYSTNDSGKFINGVLSSINKSIEHS